MEKQEVVDFLKQIQKFLFEKKQYESSTQIMLAIEVLEDMINSPYYYEDLDESKNNKTMKITKKQLQELIKEEALGLYKKYFTENFDWQEKQNALKNQEDEYDYAVFFQFDYDDGEYSGSRWSLPIEVYAKDEERAEEIAEKIFRQHIENYTGENGSLHRIVDVVVKDLKNKINESKNNKTMKITKKQLQQLIKEEVVKLNRRAILENEKKNLRNELYEMIGDNGDEEAAKWEEVSNSIFGNEEEYGQMNPVEAIAAAIEYSHKSSLHPAFIAKVVAYKIKDRY
jgi:predicted DNA-binding protein (UPF0251 family)